MPRKFFTVGPDGLGAFSRATDEHGRFAVKASCSNCSAERSIRFKASNAPIDAVARKFSQAGWSISKNYTRAVCPGCHPGGTVQAANNPNPPPSPPKPSAPSLKAQRQLHRLLEEHFEPDLFRYIGEWNDAKIADEVGLSVAYVAEVREEAYGSMVNPEVAELHAKLEAIEQQLKTDVESLTAMLDQAEKSAAKRIAEVHRRLSLLEGRA